MTHLLCLFITVIIGIIILCLLWWVWNKAKGLMSNPPFTPKAVLALDVLLSLIVAVVIIYWLISGLPCVFPLR